MRLPQELCEAIVDQFTLEDRPTLLNCTLVCRFFAVRAQKILFRTISLGRPSKTFNLDVVSIKHPTQRFLTLINGSSRLATYVEEVDITDDAHLSFYREERSWIRHDTVLHTILSKLDGLRQFSIRGNFTGNRLNFKAWHERLKHTVLMKCQSSLLTKISLNHLRNVPASILTQAPALQSIYSFNTAYMIDQTPPAQRGDRPKLDSVDLTMTSYNDWTTFYPWLLDVENSLDLTALTMFALKVDFLRDTGPDDAIEPINAIAWAVRQCAPTVEFLTLFCPIEGVFSDEFEAKDTALTPRSLVAPDGRAPVRRPQCNAAPPRTGLARDVVDGPDPRRAARPPPLAHRRAAPCSRGYARRPLLHPRPPGDGPRCGGRGGLGGARAGDYPPCGSCVRGRARGALRAVRAGGAGAYRGAPTRPTRARDC